MPITLGNDISNWQGDPNYDVLKNNTQFLFVKATEGNGYTDPKFKRNQSEGRRVGLLMGYYHFARPDLGNSPEVEADWFLKTIGDLKDFELLALDYECANQKQADVDWCKKWLDRVQEKTGIKAFMYLNQSQIRSFDWQKVIDGGYALWVAAYTYDPYKNNFVTDEFKTAAMQQWSNSQQVPGLSGNIDGNVFFGDMETLKKYGKKPAQPAPQPQPEPAKPIDDENAKIHLGKIGEVEYGDKTLKEVRDIIANDQVQISSLQNQVGTFGRVIDAVKKAFGL